MINDSAGGGVLIRGESTCTLRFNTIEGNYRANAAVLDSSKPILEQNVIQNGMGRGLVITGNAAGQYISNTIRSHSLAGVYVGGNAEPHMVRNIVCESGASGIVVEDCARGCFADNSMSGNASAAVAVQGTAAPVMERNVVLHYGKGGIWLGEKAGGIFTGNCVEDSSAGWRIGMDVTATVESPISLRSLSQYEQDLQERIQMALQAHIPKSPIYLVNSEKYNRALTFQNVSPVLSPHAPLPVGSVNQESWQRQHPYYRHRGCQLPGDARAHL